jgi:hypothetical protein
VSFSIYGIWNVKTSRWIKDEEGNRLQYGTFEQAQQAIDHKIFNPRNLPLEVRPIAESAPATDKPPEVYMGGHFGRSS